MGVHFSFSRLTVVAISGNLLKSASANQAGECRGYTAMRCPAGLAWLQESVSRMSELILIREAEY